MRRYVKKSIAVVLIMVIVFCNSIVFSAKDTYAKSAEENIRNKINSYVSSLGGRFNHEYNGRAWGCFAFANQVWKAVFGFDYYDSSKFSTFTRNYSSTSDLIAFLNSNAHAGDMLRGLSGNNDHTMILLAWDSNGIRISDGKGSGGVIWHNNVYISFNGSEWKNTYKKYFSGGKIYIRHINNSIYNSYATNDDNTPPSMTGARVVSVDKNGYTVACEAWDSSGIDGVIFPTWTSSGGQDDIIWGRGSQSGSTFTYRVNISDHGNQTGEYITHFYGYDKNGNESCGGGISVNIEHNAPQISDIRIVSIDTRYITVSCTATDASGVSKVEFPTWTKKNGQDDLKWHQHTTKNGNTFYCKIDRADHNFELSDFYIDIYGTDKLGNFGYGGGKFISSVLGDKQNLGTNFVATIVNQSAGTVLTADSDGNITGRVNKGGNNQKWEFTRNSDNTYTIKSLADKSKVIDNSGGADVNGNNIWTYSSNNSDAQKWKIYKVGTGYVFVSCNSDSKCIDLDGARSADGTNIQLYQVSASTAGVFSINKETAVSKANNSTGQNNKTNTGASANTNSTNKTKEFSTPINAGTNAYNQNNNLNTKRGQIEAFIFRMYSVALGRQADPAGLKDWSDKLESGQINAADVANGFINSAEFKARNLGDSKYLDILYRTFFDRAPDNEGKYNWMVSMTSGKSREEVLAGFVNSAEFKALCERYGISSGSMIVDGNSVSSFASGDDGIREFVKRNYTEALGRYGEEAGIRYWTEKIKSGEMSPLEVSMSFFHSQEYLNKNLGNSEYVDTLYRTFLGREPDYEGKAYWISWLTFGINRDEIMQGFAYSQEFHQIMARYGL